MLFLCAQDGRRTFPLNERYTDPKLALEDPAGTQKGGIGYCLKIYDNSTERHITVAHYEKRGDADYTLRVFNKWKAEHRDGTFHLSDYPCLA